MCGLAPYVERARWWLLGFKLNFGYKLSAFFHDSASFVCCNKPFVSLFLACQANRYDVSLLQNILSNLGIREKYHMIFAGTFLLPSFKFIWSFHLEVLQRGHTFTLESSFLNKQQASLHAWIFSYFIPIVHKNIFCLIRKSRNFIRTWSDVTN